MEYTTPYSGKVAADASFRQSPSSFPPSLWFRRPSHSFSEAGYDYLFRWRTQTFPHPSAFPFFLFLFLVVREIHVFLFFLVSTGKGGRLSVFGGEVESLQLLEAGTIFLFFLLFFLSCRQLSAFYGRGCCRCLGSPPFFPSLCRILSLFWTVARNAVFFRRNKPNPFAIVAAFSCISFLSSCQGST